MASNQPDNNCCNCLHRQLLESEPRCVKCLAAAFNTFPHWGTEGEPADADD